MPLNKHRYTLVEDETFDHCFLAGKLLTGFDEANVQMKFAKDIKFIPAKTNTKSSKK